MKIPEMILELQKRFPRSPIEAWEADYYNVLRSFQGDLLGAAFREVIAGWADPGPPKPAHIFAAIRPAKGEKPKQKWEIADAERRARFKQILATAERECAEWLKREWGGYVQVHLANVAGYVARAKEGVTIAEALACFNGRDIRPGFPLREPGEWLDQHDATIFERRLESQKRINPKGKFGKRHIAVAPGGPTADGAAMAAAAKELIASAGLAMSAERLAAIREKVNARIPPNEAA